jgi:competence protein ComEC
LDFRLAPIALATWLSAALTIGIVGLDNPIWLWVTATLCLLIGQLAFRRLAGSEIDIRTLGKMILLGAILGCTISLIRIYPLVFGPIANASSSNTVISGTAVVTSDPIISESKGDLDWVNQEVLRITLRLESAKIRNQVFDLRAPVLVFTSQPEIVAALKTAVPGQTISITGKLSTAPLGKPFAAYLKLLSEPQVIESPPQYQWLAAQLRSGLHQSLSSRSAAAQGLVPGLALGDSSALNEQLASEMQSAGLTHLIAVSGTNVTLLIVLVLALMRKFKAPKNLQYFVTVAALIGFVILVRPQPSVLRATVMGLVALAATFSRSNKSPVPALSIAVIGLVAIDPWLAMSYGFALSVAATTGLVLWVPRIINFLERKTSKRIPLWVIQILAVTIAAQFAVFPLLVALGSPLSLSAIPANMLAVPLAGPTMVLGLLAALVTPLSSELGVLVAWIAACFAELIANIAHYSAQLSWLHIPWPSGKFGILLALTMVALGVQSGIAWRRISLEHKSIFVSIVSTTLVLLWNPPSLEIRPWPPPNWVMVSCDVGQGDATVIRVGSNEAVVVDVGGDPDAIDRCLSELQITKIPLLLLTHFHADHVGGLEGVFRSRIVSQVRISPLGEPAATTAFVSKILWKLNQPVAVMTYPEQFQVNNVQFKCLWPSELILGQGSDANNASVVIAVATPEIDILLTGDIEPPAQDAIVRAIAPLDFDVIKVAHHGSKYQSTAFADWVNAEIALISVGSENNYGHPDPGTISLYELLGSKVVRTDRSGDIAIVVDNSQIRVATHR